MRRTLIVVGIMLAGLTLVIATAQSQACGAGFRTPLVRFAVAEWVVVGKVTTIEDKHVVALPHADAPMFQEYKVAVLHVTEAIKGAEGLTHIRVALEPHHEAAVGKEGCYFLMPHFKEAFCLMPQRFGPPILKQNNAGFDAEMTQHQLWSKLLRDPVAGLKSSTIEERYLTAALLVSQYRTFLAGYHSKDCKTTPVDAAQSRLIMEVLAEVDWEKACKIAHVPPVWCFRRIGPTVQDGWDPRKIEDDDDKFEAAAKKWLKANAGRFRIEAYVPG